MVCDEKQASSETAEAASHDATDELGTRCLNRILLELEQGHRAKAARLFSNACEHGVFVHDSSLYPNLVQAIGQDRASQLIDGFARRSCFYCEKGLEPCEQCEGSGKDAGKILCTACIGLSVVRCDFCVGTGLASIDTVPDGLRVPVVIRRTRLAISRMKKTLAQPMPRPLGSSPSQSLKKAARYLLDLNKLIGVLENTVAFTKEQRPKVSGSEEDVLIEVSESCVLLGSQANDRVRSVIEYMALLAQKKAKRASRNSPSRKAAIAAALFYQKLSQAPAFAGTSLEHPLLLAAPE